MKIRPHLSRRTDVWEPRTQKGPPEQRYRHRSITPIPRTRIQRIDAVPYLYHLPEVHGIQFHRRTDPLDPIIDIQRIGKEQRHIIGKPPRTRRIPDGVEFTVEIQPQVL